MGKGIEFVRTYLRNKGDGGVIRRDKRGRFVRPYIILERCEAKDSKYVLCATFMGETFKFEPPLKMGWGWKVASEN